PIHMTSKAAHLTDLCRLALALGFMALIRLTTQFGAALHYSPGPGPVGFSSLSGAQVESACALMTPPARMNSEWIAKMRRMAVAMFRSFFFIAISLFRYRMINPLSEGKIFFQRNAFFSPVVFGRAWIFFLTVRHRPISHA